MRIGSGYDSHVFAKGGRLVLCGCELPGCDGLVAHSDGDVALHALTDAILGAAALGDIGTHFPDTSQEWKGADSAKILSAAVSMAAAAGYVPGNVDLTIVCERPRLKPHVPAMRRRIAEILGVSVDRVSVKAKTNEGMDAVGEGRGIMVYAVALLEEIR